MTAHTQGATSAALLTPAELAEARRHAVITQVPDPQRPRAAATRGPAGKYVVVVGEPLAQREKALDSLRALLIIGGPLALLLASLVGYAMAAAALRPVERMRRRAAAVTASETSERLPVPLANDEIGRLGRDAERDALAAGGGVRA